MAIRFAVNEAELEQGPYVDDPSFPGGALDVAQERSAREILGQKIVVDPELTSALQQTAEVLLEEAHERMVGEGQSPVHAGADILLVHWPEYSESADELRFGIEGSEVLYNGVDWYVTGDFTDLDDALETLLTRAEIIAGPV